MKTSSTAYYVTIRVRIFWCLLVAAAVSAAMCLGFFNPLEEGIHEWLVSGKPYGGRSLHAPAGMGIVFLLCIATAALRVEQPLVMIAYSVGLAFVYSLIASVVLLTNDVVLPVTPALLGLTGTSVALETLAWSEERLKRKSLERLETAKQQFTDMLVHDLKRRMSSILLSLSVLEQNGTADDENSRELMTTIRASADRMLLLTGNLLDIRKLEEGRMLLHRETVSLRKAAQESLKELRSAGSLAGVTLSIAENGDVAIRADRSILSRVLANLLWNALQHAPPGSTVELGYRQSGESAATIHVANRGDPVSPERRERIFTAFVSGDGEVKTSRAASTGLGLTFCKLAVESHGGSIGIESPWAAHGDGVRVFFSMPLGK